MRPFRPHRGKLPETDIGPFRERASRHRRGRENDQRDTVEDQ